MAVDNLEGDWHVRGGKTELGVYRRRVIQERRVLGFMRRAKRMLGGAEVEAPKPQYFQVVCPEGHRLRGLRTGGFQALRCTECGSGVFVLPRSPLPDPLDAPARQAGPRTTASERRIVVEVPEDEPIRYHDAPTEFPDEERVDIVWEDEAASFPVAPPAPTAEIPEEYRAPRAPVEARPRRLNVPMPTEPRDASRALGGEARAAERTRREEAAEPRPRRTAQRRRTAPPAAEAELEPAGIAPNPPRHIAVREQPWARKHPIALILLGVLVLSAGTIGFRFWQAELEKLPQVADLNWKEGQAALELNAFDEAKQKLAIAARAFERLGGRDERAVKVRQLAREAAIFADLTSTRLEEIVDEAARDASPEHWAERFKAIHKGRSVIIDSAIETLPGESGAPGAYGLCYRVLLGRGSRPSRVGRIDLAGFRLFEGQKLEVGDPVLFGARLASVRLVDGVWQISLEPDSGVFLTQYKALESLGWFPPESARTAGDMPRLEPDVRMQ